MRGPATGLATLPPVIGVIDYRAGNAPSVGYALTRLGLEHELVTTPEAVARAERLVLPGVGAARSTLDSLAESGLLEPLTRRVRAEGAPLLGICIGLQVLLDHSEEGDTTGLGWIAGRVRRFPDTDRVPQIGWNAVRLVRDHPVTATLPPDAYCYFVNSYYADPTDPTDVLGRTEYSVSFCSIAARDNLVATQFHAEKSGELGLRVLDAFARWSP